MSFELQERFNKLCQIVQSLPKDGDFVIDDQSKLKFYAYFKQVTVGDVNTTQPYFFNVVERAKWDSWNSVKGLSKEAAILAYFDHMKTIIQDAPYDNEYVQKINALL